MATLQARVKTWPAISSCMSLYMFFVIMVAVVNNPVLVNAGHSAPPSYLVVYDHQNAVPPNNTAVIAVLTSGKNDSGSPLPFGSISVIANVLREGIAGDSPVLGQIDGQVTVGLDLLYISATLVLNTPSYAGSITVQGTGDLDGNGELAITGGTGVFRFATGYAVLSFTGQSDPRDTVYKISLYIKYD